jgi:thymidylate kinase
MVGCDEEGTVGLGPVERTMTQMLEPLIIKSPPRPSTPAPVDQDAVAAQLAAERAAAEALAARMSAARWATLTAALASLDRAAVAYCLTHNFSDLPDVVGHEVDGVIPAAALAGPAPAALQAATALAHAGDATGGMSLVQWFDDRSCWAVVAGEPVDGVPPLVQLHLSPGFEPDDVDCYSAYEVLADRESHHGVWTARPATEFGCVLANRVTKELLKGKHAARLTALFAEDPAGCEQQVRRFWSGDSADTILAAARSGRWSEVEQALPKLGHELRQARGKVGGRARGWGHRWDRRLRRWLRPGSGLHIVFLGPDGVGKSTVIEAVRQSLSPAFLRYSYQTFAPSLIPSSLQPKKDTPHQLPPRGLVASWIKAAWWAVCYTAGYAASVRPTLARAGLVINHRYLPDAIVDPKRYRYSGPRWVLRLLWRVAPKPDLLFVLDAPAEVIQARKKEVAPAETARQRDGYRAVATGMPNAHVISTDRPLPEVVGEVNGLVLKYMADRVARRLTEAKAK